MSNLIEKNNINVSMVIILIFVGLFGCGPKPKKSTSSDPVVIETDYCSTVKTVNNGVSVTGLSTYQYYKPAFNQGLTKDTNGEPFSNPIRRAEVRVLNSKGEVVQCSETDNSGLISLQIEKPSSTETFTLEVNSRADNSYIKASILDKVSTKRYYSILTSFSVSADASAVSLPSMVASASGTLEGGAFSILDKILLVNDYLRNNTTDSNCSICQAFTVAPKVTVFWQKGFNPASYFGESSPLSFFDVSASIDSSPALYILGGDSGDVDVSDTDHFDESVIIHEYGHFLENAFWRSDSPGGYHNGNMIIDPRLAFSEGFANFLPSAVLSRNSYIDTIGSPDGGSGVGVYLNLEDETGVSLIRDKIITKTPVGEGIFREVSISRALYDYIDADSDLTYDVAGTANTTSETSQFSFAYLWLALTNSTFGLKSSTQHFISMGNFNQALYSALDASSFSSISTEKAKLDTVLDGERQTKDLSEYGMPVTQSTTSCSRTMAPVAERTASDGSTYHDYFLSSDMFRYDHPGGAFDLQLSYSGIANLDLYVFKEAHSLTETDDTVGYSELNTGTTESISLTNLAAGTYMIFVNVDTAFSISGSTSYTLTSGGKYLCNSQ